MADSEGCRLGSYSHCHLDFAVSRAFREPARSGGGNFGTADTLVQVPKPDFHALALCARGGAQRPA